MASLTSLSARRAWIEIVSYSLPALKLIVALRKESVDRNYFADQDCDWVRVSLSARRAWIEIVMQEIAQQRKQRRSPQGERG